MSESKLSPEVTDVVARFKKAIDAASHSIQEAEEHIEIFDDERMKIILRSEWEKLRAEMWQVLDAYMK